MPYWTLEIDDSNLAAWRPILSTFRFNTVASAPADWDKQRDYRTGILIQPGIHELIPPHKGSHEAGELKSVTIRRRNGKPILVTRSHFKDLGVWINITAAGVKGLPQVSDENYIALFGPDGRSSHFAETFRPYGGGITVWPGIYRPQEPTHKEPFPFPRGGDTYCEIQLKAGGNTSNHSWKRFIFGSALVVRFHARPGSALPTEWAGSHRLGEADTKGPGGRHNPSIVILEYGIPQDGGEQDPKPKPGGGG